MKLSVYNQGGEVKGEIEVADNIFNVKNNPDLIHQAVVAQMANQRQVLAHTKGRSEVRGGGKKPWKQKGTGRARAGSSRSPLWIGGGITFGPLKTRNFSKKLNKKMGRKAIFMVLSDRINSEKLIVVEKINLDSSKTKLFNEVLKKLEKGALKKEDKTIKKSETDKETKKKQIKKAKRNILFINSEKDNGLKLAGRNLTGVKILPLNNINILDLLKYENIIFAEEAIKSFEKTYK